MLKKQVYRKIEVRYEYDLYLELNYVIAFLYTSMPLIIKEGFFCTSFKKPVHPLGEDDFTEFIVISICIKNRATDSGL
jgi:hypothetical protein